MKTQNQRSLYRLLAFTLCLLVIIPVIYKIIRCSLQFSDYLNAMVVTATLFAAYAINEVVFYNREKEIRSDYSKLISARDVFWDEINKEWGKFLDNYNHNMEPTKPWFVFKLKIVLQTPILPIGLVKSDGTKILIDNIKNYEFKKLERNGSENLKKQTHNILIDFVKYLYPEYPDERVIDDKSNICRSELGDYYEVFCNNNTYNFFRKLCSKDIALLTILTWLDIAHRQNLGEDHPGKVQMYLYTQKLLNEKKG